jgi:hypothetical protein
MAYVCQTEHKTEKPMTIITADIRNERAVVKALEGVDCVIHCAALIDTSLWPDVKSMNSVNVDGMCGQTIHVCPLYTIDTAISLGKRFMISLSLYKNIDNFFKDITY